jgi:radical SAM enzyme (TIGR01210 family)
MSEITTFCHSFRKDFIPRPQNPRQPVRCWSEKDVLHGKIVDAYVIILRTRGCSWALSSGCTMCGYFNDSTFHTISEDDLLAQVDAAIQRYNHEPIVKIFTSGSFLDPSELPVPIQQKILGSLSNTAEKISVESRPEYVTEKNLQALKQNISSQCFEVGIGLETSNDIVREKAINKGFSLKEYQQAVNILKHQNINVKTYVLLKPPFLTEKESLNDCINTIKDIGSTTNLISLNPTNVQRHTVVEYLWKKDQYRPPWLWTIIEILQQSKQITDAFIKCDVVGGGSNRGAHNCGVCDKSLRYAIEQFSLTQDRAVFQDLSCSCQEQWKDQLELESLSFGSQVDFTRWNP